MRFLCLFTTLLLSAGSPVSADDDFTSRVRPLLERYCFDCHSGEAPNGDIDFDAGYALSAALGYELVEFSDSFGLDVEVEGLYTEASFDTGPISPGSQTPEELTQFAVMAFLACDER